MEISNKEKQYMSNETTVFSCQYHVVFCPKYRRPVLVDGIDERVKQIAAEAGEAIGYILMDIEVMPNHVHLLIDVPPTKVVRNVVMRLKGKLAHELRSEFPKLKSRLPSLWTRSCFISSVGSVSLEVVKKYIENQKNK